MKKSNTTLTASDWSEIYYAVEFKRDHSPAAAHDAAWQKQLSCILEKIGPDGEHAAQAQKLQRITLETIASGNTDPDRMVQIAGAALKHVESSGNERLAIAAPELLAALELMATHWPAQKPESKAFNAYIKARAAIAKATGQN